VHTQHFDLTRSCKPLVFAFYLIKITITSGKPPNHWKHALVTPLPKVTKPSQLSDLRPISVKSVLSRVTERIIVKKNLLLSLSQSLLNDHFAYRPTGSTTAALIVLKHHAANLLETNSYVRCLMVDFSKAFGTINYAILAQKLEKNFTSQIMFITGLLVFSLCC